MIVVFDGLCDFCSGWVHFIIRRDRRLTFRFAAAQSEKGAQLLRALGLPVDNLETMVLIDGPRHYEKSDAVLEILRRLGGVWGTAQGLALVPRPFRDRCYTAFARRRYGWFGKSDQCRAPDVKWRDRFIF